MTNNTTKLAPATIRRRVTDAVNAFADSAIYLSTSGERELSDQFYAAWAKVAVIPYDDILAATGASSLDEALGDHLAEWWRLSRKPRATHQGKVAAL
jgi:hypothetical protein